ncbi:MAG: tetratricopeptide repeat protein, partial [Muribaculaceae bacterium]|nr:tetratricopeptide repeat protein [Muribaculaceae bacterium]
MQRGLVREYNERAAKTPLGGVELTVRSAGSTVSDRDGSFALEFLTLEPGERVNVRRIEKDGYVVFNKEAVEQWNLSPTSAFTVVMCRADRFKRIRDNYYRNSEERYSAQYKKERDELARLQRDGKLKEEEYRARLAEVSAEYDRQLDNLDAYVDRFARIDLSEVSAGEQEIIGLVEQGLFDEAIRKYEDLRIKEQLVEALGERRRVDAAIVHLSGVRSDLGFSIDSLYSSAERQIETLRLAGGAENKGKILEIYRDIADADTTNTEWLLKTGNYIREYVADYPLAMRYLTTALGSARRQDARGSVSEAAVSGVIGDVCHDRGDYAGAEEWYGRALSIMETKLGRENVDVARIYNKLGNT